MSLDVLLETTFCVCPIPSKIWQLLPEFDETNTILVDNEAKKFRNTPDNGIVVPKYGPREVTAATEEVLKELGDYLVALAENEPEDVRVYLKKNPLLGEEGANPEPEKAAAPSSEGAPGSGESASSLGAVCSHGTASSRKDSSPTRAVDIAAELEGLNIGREDFQRKVESQIPAETKLTLVSEKKGKFEMNNVLMGLTVSGRAPRGMTLNSTMVYSTLLAAIPDATVLLNVSRKKMNKGPNNEELEGEGGSEIPEEKVGAAASCNS